MSVVNYELKVCFFGGKYSFPKITEVPENSERIAQGRPYLGLN